MPRPKAHGPKVYGPYPDGASFRLIVVREGKRTTRSYATEQEALDDKAGLEALREVTLGETCEDTLADYETHLRTVGNRGTPCKPGTIATTLYRLRALLAAELTTPVARLTSERAVELYAAYAQTVAVDTHRNTLGQAKTWGAWLVRERKIPENPWAAISGTGRRSQGKEQLRVDEARAWLSVALDWVTLPSRYPGERRNHAEARRAGSLAAACAFLMGMRSDEIKSRQARDLDDDGRLLWIPDAKTAAGRRRLAVPEVLRPHLLALARGKGAEAALFPCSGPDWVREWTLRICDEAKVSRVCAHSLRGLHSTLAEAVGVTGPIVAQALGHTSAEVTHRHYTQGAALEAARQERVLQVLEGGTRKAREIAERGAEAEERKS
jgi:integrase